MKENSEKDKGFFAVDEKMTSGMVDELNERFEKGLDRYFDDLGGLKKEFSERVDCPNCGEKEGRQFIQKRFSYVRCAGCGMVYCSPRLNSEVNTRIHSRETYIEHFKLKVIPSIDYRRDVLARRKYEQLMGFFKGSGRVIDIGCGLGEVLSVFQENGWDAMGVDFNEFAIEYAREKFGVKIINKDIFELDMPEKFDLVMLWGVLEHVYEPFKLLEKARSILKPDGLMLVEVPSADSVLVRYCEGTGTEAHRTFESARHIMLFSRKALVGMCARSGFSCEKLVSNGLDITTLCRMKSLDMSPEISGRLQMMLDDSLQGDLLRGFFRKEGK